MTFKNTTPTAQERNAMSATEPTYAKVLPKVVKAIRASSSLAAQDVKFYSSLDPRLAVALEKTGKSMLSLANRLMSDISTDYEAVEYGESEIKRAATWKNIGDALDTCFEKVDISLDTIKNPERKEGQMHHLLELHNEIVPEVTEKPQSLFEIQIDNSDAHPFKPKLTNKPHALQSLNDSIKFVSASDKQSGPHYLHPYELEIMQQPYPESQLKVHEPIPSTNWSSTAPIWVDSLEKLQEMVNQLMSLTEIAVDLEHHDYRSYYGITCLMQISDRKNDWLIDTLALRSKLEILNEVFTNPSIVKVFHGANMDIIWLQRDLGLYIVSLFDTYHASKKLGFPKFSLAYLLETIAHFKTSKKYQLADWRIRPLTPMMTQYARADTHFLLYIYDVLRNKLIEKGVLPDVLYESRLVAKRRFEYNKFKNDWNDWPNSNPGNSSLKWLMSQYNLPNSRKQILESLLSWRDTLARRTDESPRFILSNQSLINLCTLNLPIDNQSISSAMGRCSEMVKDEIETLSSILNRDLSKASDESDTIQHADLHTDIIDYPNASSISELFSQLENSVCNDHHLILDSSSFFSSLHAVYSGPCSVKYDQTFGMLPVTGAEFDKRRQILTDFNSKSVQEHEDYLSDSEAIVSTTLLLAPPIQEQENGHINSKEDPQIFTLSKKRTKTKQTVQHHIESAPIVDYNSPDNASVFNAILPESKGKKRSFDPFAKLNSGGPRPAKRGKSTINGKSASFKNKKR